MRGSVIFKTGSYSMHAAIITDDRRNHTACIAISCIGEDFIIPVMAHISKPLVGGSKSGITLEIAILGPEENKGVKLSIRRSAYAPAAINLKAMLVIYNVAYEPCGK